MRLSEMDPVSERRKTSQRVRRNQKRTGRAICGAESERTVGSSSSTAWSLTVQEAASNWLLHRTQAGMQNRKAKLMSEKLLAFCKSPVYFSLSQITRAHLSDFKLGLTFRSGDSNSLRVHLSVLGGMFRWCVEEAGYLSVNPFPKFKLKFDKPEVVIPTTEEVSRVLAYEPTRLFASLLRFSGMAIQDAATVKRSQLVGNLITGRRCKTDEAFRVRIPVWLADEMRALPGEWFFWDGRIQSESVAENWRKKLTEAFKSAGVKMTHMGSGTSLSVPLWQPASPSKMSPTWLALRRMRFARPPPLDKRSDRQTGLGSGASLDQAGTRQGRWAAEGGGAMTRCTSRPDSPCTICEELRARCERELDAEMNAEMLERQKTDPAFAEEQRRLVEEFMRQFSECTSRPGCPCDFCVPLRAKIAEGRSEKDERTNSPKTSSARIRRPTNESGRSKRLFNTSHCPTRRRYCSAR